MKCNPMRAALLAGLLVIVSGCPNVSKPKTERLDSASYGYVVIRLNDMRAQMFLPEISSVIVSYVVSFTHKGFETVTLSEVPGDATETEPVRLRLGTWEVSVSAFNEERAIIGEGTAAVSVAGGRTSTVPLPIRLLAGKGALSLSADIRDLDLLSPSVSGTLQCGVTDEASGVSMGFDGSVGTFEQSLEAGTYLLSLELFDGESTIAGYVNAVLIFSEEVTSAGLVFRSEEGTVVVELIGKSVAPIVNVITLEGLQETVGSEESMSVSAQTAVAVDSYQWYLDGYAIPGAEGQEISLGPGLDERAYVLTVVVKRGDFYSAEAAEFTVVSDISEDPVGFSFSESVVIEFTIDNWSYADYSSVLEVAFLHEGEVLFSHDVGIENAVEDEGWVFSFGYVFAYADETGTFTLLEVPPLAHVTEVRIVIDDWTSGTFGYQFFTESLEGQTFAVSVSQGNEIFILTPA